MEASRTIISLTSGGVHTTTCSGTVRFQANLDLAGKATLGSVSAGCWGLSRAPQKLLNASQKTYPRCPFRPACLRPFPPTRGPDTGPGGKAGDGGARLAGQTVGNRACNTSPA